MEAYPIILLLLTLMATLRSGTCIVSEMTLTEGEAFTFQCGIATDALELFENPLLYYYYDPVKNSSVQLTHNSRSLDAEWNVQILKTSNDTHFNFQMSGMVDLADSGTYSCIRKINEVIIYNNSVVLTVKELTEDVGDIDFSITLLDSNKIPTNEEYFLTRQAGTADPPAKEVNIDSGFYRAICGAKGGKPQPTYLLKTGEINVEFGTSKDVLLNSKTPDLSCTVENGAFTHHLQFILTINPGHPDFTCDKAVASVGDTDAEIHCLVSGENLDCNHFQWISQMDGSRFSVKGNYTVECVVNEDHNSMKSILKFGSVTKADFDDGYILKFENHLKETYQEVLKLTEKKVMDQIGAGNNVVPMGTVTLVFLSVLGMLL